MIQISLSSLSSLPPDPSIGSSESTPSSDVIGAALPVKEASLQIPTLDIAKVSNSSITFRISQRVNVAALVASGISTLRVSLASAEQPKSQQTSVAHSQSIADEIAKENVHAKQNAESVAASVVASVIIDLTAYVDNSKTSALAVGVAPEQSAPVLVTGLGAQSQVFPVALFMGHKQKKALALIKAGTLGGADVAPILGSGKSAQEIVEIGALVAQVIKRSSRELARDLIQLGVDPTEIIRVSNAVDSFDALGGFGRKSETIVSDGTNILQDRRADLLRQWHARIVGTAAPFIASTNDAPADAIVPVVVSLSQVMFDVSATISVHIQKLSTVLATGMVVISDAVDAFDKTLATRVSVHDVAKLMSKFMSRAVKFDAAMRFQEKSSIASVDLSNIEDGISKIAVYVKRIRRVGFETKSYAFDSTIPLTAGIKNASVPIDIAGSESVIIRCVPTSAGGEQSHSFVSRVVTFDRRRNGSLSPSFGSLRLSLVADSLSDGIRLIVANVPMYVRAVKLLRRDLTLHEREFKLIRGVTDFFLASDGSQPIVVLDRNLRFGHVYQYACDVIDRSGLVRRASAVAFVKHDHVMPGIAKTIITDDVLTLDEVEPNFAFVIVSDVIDTQSHTLRNLLDFQNLLTLFSDEIKNDRDLLKQLIAHHVTRIDLTSGDVVDFGMVAGENFSDQDRRTVVGAPALQRGRSYRYVIRTLLRSPETLFEKFKKKVTLSSGKTYEYNPSKFFHPLVFSDGNITSTQSRQRNHARDEMSFGAVGSAVEIDVDVPSTFASVTSAIVERLPGTRAGFVVRWETMGSDEDFDHFVILRDRFGIRSVAGVAHNISQFRKHSFVCHGGCDNFGLLRYVVVPVYADYSIGHEIITNEILNG